MQYYLWISTKIKPGDKGKAGSDGALGWAIRQNNQKNHKNFRSVRQGNSTVTIITDARRQIFDMLNNDGKRPEHGFFHSEGSDGTVGKNDFGHVEPYREAEFTEDLTLLKNITSDENVWQEFLGDLACEMKDALKIFFKNQIKGNTAGKKDGITKSVLKSDIPQNIGGRIMKILGIGQSKGGAIGENEDVENNHVPKKWNQAMGILGIEKWNIRVDKDESSKEVTIDLQILEAESLKEKLKRFIADKEKSK